MTIRRFVVAAIACFCVTLSYARPAKVFSFKTSNAPEIRTDKGHLNMTFVAGWISNKDTLIRKLFSNNTKLAASASATGTYFDGDTLKNSWIIENTDVPHTFNRPWGIANRPLLTGIPADTAITTFNVQMATYREDRFAALISSFKQSEPTSGLSVEPYLTYATMVDSFLATLFNTNKTDYPFVLDAGLSDPNVTSANGIYEHYIVGIVPSSNNDTWLEQLDGTKLSYDPAAGKLTYNGQLVTDHTYAVLWVANAAPPNIPQLLFESKSAWAVLALTDFYNAPLPDLANKDDVPKTDKAFVPELAACIDQLKRELRFSAYDRAVALQAFAERAKKMIANACTAKGIATADCKTPQIQSFEDGINGIFGLTNPQTKQEVPKAVEQLNQALYQLLNLQ